MNKSRAISTVLAVVALLALGALTSCSQTATAGPNGGDVVPIENGTAKAEVVANAETGEVMVHTWDNDLEDHRPVEAEPLRIGSADASVQLMPHPLPSDPPGQCSRFYGHAEWLHGGSIERGWLECCGSRATRHQFAWSNCWRAGGRHGAMWSEMGEHRPRGAGGKGGIGRGHGGG
jgi:hypothetical protein